MTLAMITPGIAHFGAPRPAPRLAPAAARQRAWRVLLLLLAVALLNGFDLACTLFANRINMLNEMNPLAAMFLKQGMIWGLIGFKVLVVLCSLGTLWKLRSCRLTVAACWVVLLTYACLGAVWYQWAHVVNTTFEMRMTMAPQ